MAALKYIALAILFAVIFFSDRIPKNRLELVQVSIPLVMLGAYLLGYPKRQFSLVRLFVLTTVMAVIMAIYRTLGWLDAIYAACLVTIFVQGYEGPPEKRNSAWIRGSVTFGLYVLLKLVLP